LSLVHKLTFFVAFVASIGDARGRGALDRFQTSTVLSWKDDEPIVMKMNEVNGIIWKLEEIEVLFWGVSNRGDRLTVLVASEGSLFRCFVY
jgi:hypothetical protein